MVGIHSLEKLDIKESDLTPSRAVTHMMGLCERITVADVGTLKFDDQSLMQTGERVHGMGVFKNENPGDQVQVMYWFAKAVSQEGGMISVNGNNEWAFVDSKENARAGSSFPGLDAANAVCADESSSLVEAGEHSNTAPRKQNLVLARAPA